MMFHVLFVTPERGETNKCCESLYSQPPAAEVGVNTIRVASCDVENQTKLV